MAEVLIVSAVILLVGSVVAVGAAALYVRLRRKRALPARHPAPEPQRAQDIVLAVQSPPALAVVPLPPSEPLEAEEAQESETAPVVPIEVRERLLGRKDVAQVRFFRKSAMSRMSAWGTTNSPPDSRWRALHTDNYWAWYREE